MKDVHVFSRDQLDPDSAGQFAKPWLVQYEDGRIVEHDTEDEACAAQRQHRVSVGLNELTGDPV